MIGQQKCAIRNAAGVIRIMCIENHRQSFLMRQHINQIHDPELIAEIKSRLRFIHDQHLRLGSQGSCDQHQLQFSARNFIAAAIAQLINPGLLHCLNGNLFIFSLRHLKEAEIWTSAHQHRFFYRIGKRLTAGLRNICTHAPELLIRYFRARSAVDPNLTFLQLQKAKQAS